MKMLSLIDTHHVSGGNPAIAFTTALTLTRENYDPEVAIGLGTIIGFSISSVLFIGVDITTVVKHAVSAVMGGIGGYLLGYAIKKDK